MNAAAEQRRIEALRAYDLLIPGFEEPFEVIARLAAHVSGAPVALVNVIDSAK